MKPSVKKAVITAAGSGSRLLPFSKETPKEMLPIHVHARDGSVILKPILQVVYESLHAHGIRDFCFVVGRKKRSVEDYFTIDDSPMYSGNAELQDFYKKLEACRIVYGQQPSPRGFGDAVLQAKIFAEDHTFLLQAGDDVILSRNSSHIKRLEREFFSSGADLAFLVEKVKDPTLYGVIEGEQLGKAILVKGIEEKPRRPKTDLAVVATYIFKPSIFGELESIGPDESGEIQLTDAIRSAVTRGKVIAVELNHREKRVDVGTPQGYIECMRSPIWV